MAIEVLSPMNKGGVQAFIPPQIFVQPTQPADTGYPYIWIQTGLANNGIMVWYNNNGVT